MRATLTIITSLALVIGLILELGGCQARYRYPCQDPENWGKPECHNEACKADGSCTDQTLGSVYTPANFESQRLTDEPPQKETKPEESKPEETIPEETKPEPRPQISSNACQPAAQPERKINFRGKAMPPPPMAPPAEAPEPVVEGEQPVTMDTVVNTAEHNMAAR